MITVQVVGSQQVVAFPNAYHASVTMFSGMLKIYDGPCIAQFGPGSWITYWYGDGSMPRTKAEYKRAKRGH